jgi:hypothetical protein
MTLPADRYIERALEVSGWAATMVKHVKDGPDIYPEIIALAAMYQTYEPTDPPEPPEMKAAREYAERKYGGCVGFIPDGKEDFLAGWAACLAHQKEAGE